MKTCPLPMAAIARANHSEQHSAQKPANDGTSEQHAAHSIREAS